MTSKKISALLFDLDTKESREEARLAIMSTYLGMRCKLCGKEYKTLDDLEGTVGAGRHEHGVLACGTCWENRERGRMEDSALHEEFLRCACHSLDHTLSLSYFADEKDKFEQVMYLNVHLHDSARWPKRLWSAIRYIFGYHCRYGHWDEFILTKEKAQTIYTFIGSFSECYDEEEG
jgi:hypothetical protein